MTEKLIVRNFAGIKEIDLEVKRINILIGPQASGKSVCAKLLFYFKNFVWEILSTVENNQTKRNLDSNCVMTFEEYFPPESWGNHHFLIKYEISDVFIQISRSPGSRKKVALTYSNFFKEEFKKLPLLLKTLGNKISREDKITHFLNLMPFDGTGSRFAWADSLSSSLGKEAAFFQLFIPAGRSFFALLQKNLFSFLASGNTLDPFIKAFGATYERLKIKPGANLDRSKDIEGEINRLVEQSLCGKHIHEDGKDFLEVADSRRVSIANSSSGQQETLPLTVILTALPYLTSSHFGRTVYIEEPEAYLFPSAQRSIIELIAIMFNYRKEKLQFFITTHSPYVLTVINNLLQAGLLYEAANPDGLRQIEQIVPRYKALNTSDLSAYMLIDGKCSSIICAETGLIDAKLIDSVSDDLAIEFDQLLDLV